MTRLEMASSTQKDLDESLLLAFKADDISGVRAALENGANANYVDADVRGCQATVTLLMLFYNMELILSLRGEMDVRLCFLLSPTNTDLLPLEDCCSTQNDGIRVIVCHLTQQLPSHHN